MSASWLNQLLNQVAPMQPLLIPVDNMGNRTSRQQVEAMREHLDQGRALIMFPAGSVRLKPNGVRMDAGKAASCAWRRAAGHRLCPCMSAVVTRHCST